MDGGAHRWFVGVVVIEYVPEEVLALLRTALLRSPGFQLEKIAQKLRQLRIATQRPSPLYAGLQLGADRISAIVSQSNIARPKRLDKHPSW